MRACIALILAVVLTMPMVQAQEPGGRKYALLVGVQQYDPNQLRNLPYAEADVTELAALLTQAGFRRVVLLTQTEGAKQFQRAPTAANIRTSLAGILEDRTKDDLVVVGFAGHGVQFKSEDENYFCPMDAVLTKRQSLVSLKEVYTALEKSAAGTKLLMVDACRNDPLAENARDAGDVKLESVTRPQTVDPPGGVAAFFSCSRGQKAFEDGRVLKHGVFFHHVILGLKGAARLSTRDEVTWDSLVAYTKAEVPDTVKDLFGDGVRQVPEHRGQLKGSVSLVSLGKTGVHNSIPSSASVTGSAAAAAFTSKSTGMKFSLIQPGTFTMGSPASEAGRDEGEEGPQHTVRITKPFYLGVYEVTQAEYESEMGTNPSYFSKAGTGSSKVSGQDTGKFPVETVSWFDAIEFCNKLSAKDGLTPYYSQTNVQRDSGSIKSASVSVAGGKGYRLPTEAEWEYACRATTTTPFHFGGILNGDKANADGNFPYGTDTNGTSLDWTTAVGSYQPNAFGLYDMHGNVYEWCWDWYDKKFYSQLASSTASDPVGPSSGSLRVIRGGSWINQSQNARSASRWGKSPADRLYYIGVRLARTP